MPEEQNFLHHITGSFSQPAAENPTVEMVEAAYRHHGLHYRYLNTEVPPEDLAAAVAGARAMNWAGFNCSIPHKVAVIKHLDGLGESASVIGAVNCAVRRDGQYIGENTDGKGFLKSLQGVVDPAGKKLVMFGAGGAARAIGVECALAGAAHFTIVNRSEDRGNDLVSLLNEKTPVTAVLKKWEGDYSVPAGTDVVINATSIGLADAEARLALNVDSLAESMVVADVIPNPPRTQLIRAAEAKGCTVIDGLGMLVNQGITGIEYWTGQTADGNVMRARLEELFGD
jgi:shikimate dehydrogenase